MEKTSDTNIKMSPLKQRYFDVKYKYPEHILLFQVAGFYSVYGKDAIVVSDTLGIPLTTCNDGSNIELTGFPYRLISDYLPRLVKSGLRVVVCDYFIA